ncbi:Protein of unknown function [Lactobacillus pasteurii DSM 23907 = CRBIP 24.76]|uniref:Uncharacterized protein n=1 Tax=Lactobacillus pasteurii DSM 23907 = CRBIP 24.76 TaxID=1423790 RepID=I7JXE8_9LACO|nr:Protein of unknown function [Lactobacillus pasteurii DSM 23907 = CRBIP 24.76]
MSNKKNKYLGTAGSVYFSYFVMGLGDVPTCTI